MDSLVLRKCLLFFVLAGICLADDIDYEVNERRMMKIIRQMVNQTKADRLNLPSNSTTIRENITDTFSCEGLTYGYYADVDNDCQVFHVCLPSQAPSGRNTTYRWSFICPKETIFNQEVLVCTRARDAIDCADSPMYYDVNMDIGKIEVMEENTINKETSERRTKPKGSKRKHNLVQELSRNRVEDVGDDEMRRDEERLISERNYKRRGGLFRF